MRVSLLPLSAAVITLAGLAAMPAAFAQDDADTQPHLLNCTVLDTVHLTDDGTLAEDPPLKPGTRALGRITTFVVDVASAVVRLPGLADIAWIPAKGDQTSAQLVLTPTSALDSATMISLHINRTPNNTWFLFFETDRVMSGTCVLLPVSP